MNYRCRYLAHGLYLSFNCFRHCHLSIHAPELRELYNYIVPYKGPKDKVNWERVFSIKRKLVQEMRDGNIPSFCKGCRWVEEFDENSSEQFLSDLEPYIDMIWLGHFDECNAKCIYCMSFEAISQNKMTKDYGVIALLKEMLDKKYSRVGYDEEKRYLRVYDAKNSQEVAKYLYDNKIIVNELRSDKIGLEEYYINLMNGKEEK